MFHVPRIAEPVVSDHATPVKKRVPLPRPAPATAHRPTTPNEQRHFSDIIQSPLTQHTPTPAPAALPVPLLPFHRAFQADGWRIAINTPEDRWSGRHVVTSIYALLWLKSPTHVLNYSSDRHWIQKVRHMMQMRNAASLAGPNSRATTAALPTFSEEAEFSLAHALHLPHTIIYTQDQSDRGPCELLHLSSLPSHIWQRDAAESSSSDPSLSPFADVPIHPSVWYFSRHASQGQNEILRKNKPIHAIEHLKELKKVFLKGGKKQAHTRPGSAKSHQQQHSNTSTPTPSRPTTAVSGSRRIVSLTAPPPPIASSVSTPSKSWTDSLHASHLSEPDLDVVAQYTSLDSERGTHVAWMTREDMAEWIEKEEGRLTAEAAAEAEKEKEADSRPSRPATASSKVSEKQRKDRIRQSLYANLYNELDLLPPPVSSAPSISSDGTVSFPSSSSGVPLVGVGTKARTTPLRPDPIALHPTVTPNTKQFKGRRLVGMIQEFVPPPGQQAEVIQLTWKNQPLQEYAMKAKEAKRKRREMKRLRSLVRHRHARTLSGDSTILEGDEYDDEEPEHRLERITSEATLAKHELEQMEQHRNVCLISRRINYLPMIDTDAKRGQRDPRLYERMCCFSYGEHAPPVIDSTVLNGILYTRLSYVCEIISQHIRHISSDALKIHEMNLFFQIDADHRLYFLWCDKLVYQHEIELMKGPNRPMPPQIPSDDDSNGDDGVDVDGVDRNSKVVIDVDRDCEGSVGSTFVIDWSTFDFSSFPSPSSMSTLLSDALQGRYHKLIGKQIPASNTQSLKDDPYEEEEREEKEQQEKEEAEEKQKRESTQQSSVTHVDTFSPASVSRLSSRPHTRPATATLTPETGTLRTADTNNSNKPTPAVFTFPTATPPPTSNVATIESVSSMDGFVVRLEDASFGEQEDSSTDSTNLQIYLPQSMTPKEKENADTSVETEPDYTYTISSHSHLRDDDDVDDDDDDDVALDGAPPVPVSPPAVEQHESSSSSSDDEHVPPITDVDDAPAQLAALLANQERVESKSEWADEILFEFARKRQAERNHFRSQEAAYTNERAAKKAAVFSTAAATPTGVMPTTATSKGVVSAPPKKGKQGINLLDGSAGTAFGLLTSPGRREMSSPAAFLLAKHQKLYGTGVDVSGHRMVRGAATPANTSGLELCPSLTKSAWESRGVAAARRERAQLEASPHSGYRMRQIALLAQPTDQQRVNKVDTPSKEREQQNKHQMEKSSKEQFVARVRAQFEDATNTHPLRSSASLSAIGRSVTSSNARTLGHSASTTSFAPPRRVSIDDGDGGDDADGTFLTSTALSPRSLTAQARNPAPLPPGVTALTFAAPNSPSSSAAAPPTNYFTCPKCRLNLQISSVHSTLILDILGEYGRMCQMLKDHRTQFTKEIQFKFRSTKTSDKDLQDYLDLNYMGEDTIPPTLAFVFPHMTYEQYGHYREDPDFLRSTIDLCTDCHILLRVPLRDGSMEEVTTTTPLELENGSSLTAEPHQQFHNPNTEARKPGLSHAAIMTRQAYRALDQEVEDRSFLEESRARDWSRQHRAPGEVDPYAAAANLVPLDVRRLNQSTVELLSQIPYNDLEIAEFDRLREEEELKNQGKEKSTAVRKILDKYKRNATQHAESHGHVTKDTPLTFERKARQQKLLTAAGMPPPNANQPTVQAMPVRPGSALVKNPNPFMQPRGMQKVIAPPNSLRGAENARRAAESARHLDDSAPPHTPSQLMSRYDPDLVSRMGGATVTPAADAQLLQSTRRRDATEDLLTTIISTSASVRAQHKKESEDDRKYGPLRFQTKFSHRYALANNQFAPIYAQLTQGKRVAHPVDHVAMEMASQHQHAATKAEFNTSRHDTHTSNSHTPQRKRPHTAGTKVDTPTTPLMRLHATKMGSSVTTAHVALQDLPMPYSVITPSPYSPQLITIAHNRGQIQPNASLTTPTM